MTTTLTLDDPFLADDLTADDMANVSSNIDVDDDLTHVDADEVFFEEMVKRVLCATGKTQKRYREGLVSLLPFLGNHDSKLGNVMTLVQELGSQEAIVAGIDLMTGFGEAVVDKACKAAWNADGIGRSAAFTLAAAASRTQPRVVHWIAATAENPAMIEAVLDFLADQPPEEAIPLVRRILARDELPERIKKLAEDTLTDLANVRSSR